MRSGLSFARSSLLVLGLATPGIGAVQYSITDLGTLGGTTTTAAAINASGEIAGDSLDSSSVRRGFIWANGQMTPLGTDNGLTAFARNVNTSGQVEGNLSDGEIFVWSNGQFTTTLPIPLGGTSDRANGFNDPGEITGQLKLASGQIHAFFYNPANGGSETDIGTVGGASTDFSYGSSINSSGQIEGDSINGSGLDHAFIWTPGIGFKDLGTLGGAASSGIAVNNEGHATGTSQTGNTAANGQPESHLFLFDGTQMHDAGSLGGYFTNAGGMNNADQIVGFSYLADNVTQHAFLYANGGMSDLNNLIPSNTGFVLTNGAGINDSGEIAAYGVNASGTEDAFLLVPLPEPGAMGVLAVGIAMGMLRRRRCGEKCSPQ